MRRTTPLSGLLVLVALALGTTGVGACSIDGVPSVSANGRLAVRNLVVPKKANFLTWSPFEFRQPFARTTALQLREDTAKVAQALGPTALHERWQWQFGDGQSATGVRVTHRYARTGQYRIVVSAYDPSTKQWFPFDSVQVTIQR